MNIQIKNCRTGLINLHITICTELAKEDGADDCVKRRTCETFLSKPYEYLLGGRHHLRMRIVCLRHEAELNSKLSWNGGYLLL